MRIAQVPPLYESVPPKLYGGTERVVSYLTDELVKLGHDVTLFGTEDSVTTARVFPVCKEATRLNIACRDPLAWHIYQLQLVLEHASEFDIIHFHTDYLHYPVSKTARYVHLTTLHGRLDLDDLKPLYSKFSDIPVVSISAHQRLPLPHINWAKTIYHGLPQNLYSAGDGKGGYLAFLGRISPEKRPDRAIKIAKQTGIKLKIAAKIDDADRQYYESTIKPLMNHPLVEYIGEIGEDQKGAFLGNALALLFPIDWPEPFGMVMIEAMANGTPVVAFNCGSVPEIVDDGVTGFIVNSLEEAVKCIGKIPALDRRRCRKVFEDRFSADVMARNYITLYQQLVQNKRNAHRAKKINLRPFSRRYATVTVN